MRRGRIWRGKSEGAELEGETQRGPAISEKETGK
jgi:hypothetical protein